MQWRKVKCIMIAILLFGNVLLSMRIAYAVHEAHNRKNDNLANVQTVLARYGATLADDFRMPDDLAMPVLHVERQRAVEETFAEAVLSAGYAQQEEDTKVYFESETGYLSWSSDGMLEGAVIPCDDAGDRGIKKQAEALFADWGIRPKDAEITAISEDTVEMTSKVAGLPVFNRHLTLFFAESEIRITGWWSFATPYAVTNEPDVHCNASDALLHFAASQTDEIGTIERMTLGYCLQPNRGRMLKLIPAWQIETADEVFLLNASGNEIVAEGYD